MIDIAEPTIHEDRGSLARPVKTEAGTVLEGRAARVHPPGDGLKYSDGNGGIREELRNRAGLEKIADLLPNVVVTYNHGGRPIGKVTASRIDDDHVVATMLMNVDWDFDAVDERELSIGYRARLVDGYQDISEVFELSLVPRARCGKSCSIADSREDCAADCACKSPLATPVPAPALDEALRADLASITARADELTTHLALATARADEATKTVALVTARADETAKALAIAEAKLADLEATIEDRIHDRATAILDAEESRADARVALQALRDRGAAALVPSGRDAERAAQRRAASELQNAWKVKP